jgi:PII-like signaling protein
VNENCSKLTTYFGERRRSGDAFVADALFDTYGRHEVATSVLLRGALGFGLGHHLRTDRLLTSSEDLPVVSVAVDTRERIDALLRDVMAIKRHGLVTLERARMLTGDIREVALPEELHEATKLTVYVGRQERVAGTPAFAAVCDLLYRRGVAGATAFLGVDGTVHGRRARARFFARNAEVPMMVIAVGAGERIARVLPELGAMLHEPLFTLERVRVCKRDGELIERPHELPAVDEHGMAMWQKLMVYASEQAKADGHPLYQELVRRLREAGASGATVLRGIWGFHGDHEPHGDRFLSLRRHVPVMTVLIDTPQRIEGLFDVVDEVTREVGLVTSEMVPAMTALAGDERRGGLKLARHRF